MANEKKPAAGNRRQFVRTRVPLAERTASLVIFVLLLVIGVVVTSKTEMNSDNSIAVAGGAATAGPSLSLASVTAPILADAGGGIQISTNPVSLQPMTALFGQDNPLLHSVSFGH